MHEKCPFCRIQWHSEKETFKIASKSRICKEFTNLEPESESRICEDHELWNHEMWGPPVFRILLLFLKSNFSFSAHISPFYVMIYDSKTWIGIPNTDLILYWN